MSTQNQGDLPPFPLPAGGKIPAGLATYIMLGASAVAAVVAAVLGVLEGADTPTVWVLIVAVAGALIRWNDGRMAQAAARVSTPATVVTPAASFATQLYTDGKVGEDLEDQAVAPELDREPDVYDPQGDRGDMTVEEWQRTQPEGS